MTEAVLGALPSPPELAQGGVLHETANRLAVLAARRSFRLPYFPAQMSIRRVDGGVRFETQRVSPDTPPAAFAASYAPAGPVGAARAGTRAYFLTERYCLYTTDERGAVMRAEIQHPPWPLQPAGATIAENSG